MDALVAAGGYGNAEERAKRYVSADPELAKTLKMVMGRDGFYREVNREVAERIRRQGFKS